MISTIIYTRVSTDPEMPNVRNHSICNFPPLSPEDALEEHSLLDSVVWPETPLLPDSVSLEQTSDPPHSTFTILPRRGGGQWHLGDQLEVMINIFDYQGCSKKSGGDLLFAPASQPRAPCRCGWASGGSSQWQLLCCILFTLGRRRTGWGDAKNYHVKCDCRCLHLNQIF